MADREQNESRERFEKWYDDSPYGNCDAYIHTRMLSAWQAAERDTLERAAQLIENAQFPESFRQTKIYTEFERGGDNYLKMIADAIRDLGKGKVQEKISISSTEILCVRCQLDKEEASRRDLTTKLVDRLMVERAAQIVSNWLDEHESLGTHKLADAIRDLVKS